MLPPILMTDRLQLRPFTVDDAPALQKYFNNWNIVRQLTTSVPWPYPADGALTFINQVVLPGYESGTSLTWALTERSDDSDEDTELIGCIEFMFEDSGVGNRGFWLAEPFWGRGYMTEAVTAVQDYVLLDLGIEQMIVLNSVENPASRRIKEKTGARWIGHVQIPHNNGETTSDKWEITRTDWANQRNRPLSH